MRRSGVVQLGWGAQQRLIDPSGGEDRCAEPAVRAALAAAGLPVAARARPRWGVQVVGWRVVAASRPTPEGPRADVTDELPPSLAGTAERAADVLGLDLAEVELSADGRIVSIRSGPHLHLHPRREAAVARAVVRCLVPAGARCRVPLAVVLGADDVVLALAEILGAEGRIVGTGPDARVLSHPHVESAVIGVAAGTRPELHGLLHPDVVVVGAAATADAVGVVRTLPRDGALVLSTSSAPRAHALVAATDATVIQCAVAADDPLLEAQILSGGAAAFPAHGGIELRHGPLSWRLLDAAPPAADLGTVLLASAAAWALGRAPP